MNITLDDIEQIRRDEKTLKELIATIEEGYSFLSAQCQHAMGGHTGEDEAPVDDEELEDDLKIVDETARALMPLDQQIIKSDSVVDTSLPENTEPDESIFFEGTESKKSEEKDDAIPIKTLYRMIKQASHPDKIMRFSAEQKKQILECFHESTGHMEDENVEALVFCYVRLFLIRGEPKRITYWVWKYVKERHNQVKYHTSYLLDRPYMNAIKAWKNGDIELAVRAFRYYLNSQQDDDDDDFFND